MLSRPRMFHEGYLPEQDGHQVYYAQYGNPAGETIVVLHGGPGSRSKPQHVKNYDLEKYRVVVFDQRGCGRSLPLGDIQSNTTHHLIADMERLRTLVKAEQWYVAGGSWGSTLALAYAEKHSQRVKGLLLSSLFLARPRDIRWASGEDDGIQRFFPDMWEQRLLFFRRQKVNPSDAANVLLKKIQTGTQETAKKIVAGVANWESNLRSAQENVRFVTSEDVSEEDIAHTTVFLHYVAHRFFLKPNELLKNMAKVKAIPTVIVHGRYDALCPVEQAWEVRKRLSRAELLILPTSNHKLTAEGEMVLKLAFHSFLDHCSHFPQRVSR